MTPEEAAALDDELRLTLDIAEVDPRAVDLVALLEDEMLLGLPEKLCVEEPCPRIPKLSYGPADAELEKMATGTSAGNALVDGDRQRPFEDLRSMLASRQPSEDDR